MSEETKNITTTEATEEATMITISKEELQQMVAQMTFKNQFAFNNQPKKKSKTELLIECLKVGETISISYSLYKKCMMSYLNADNYNPINKTIDICINNEEDIIHYTKCLENIERW